MKSMSLERKRPTVAVIVGSGGIKTLAAAEVSRFLEQEQIPVDLLVGCSGGSIMASLCGCGYSPEEMTQHVSRFWNRRLFSRMDLRTILNILRVPLFRFQKDYAFFQLP